MPMYMKFSLLLTLADFQKNYRKQLILFPVNENVIYRNSEEFSVDSNYRSLHSNNENDHVQGEAK